MRRKKLEIVGKGRKNFIRKKANAKPNLILALDALCWIGGRILWDSEGRNGLFMLFDGWGKANQPNIWMNLWGKKGVNERNKRERKSQIEVNSK
jgi:hypothetical protein